MERLVITVAVVMLIEFYAVMGFLWWRIIRKTGHHPFFFLLMLVPVVNIVMLSFLALKAWPIERSAPLPGPNPWPTPLVALTGFLGVLPILTLCVGLMLPSQLKSKIAANEALARQTVTEISAGIEKYAADNKGEYPPDEFALKYASPPYLSRTYNERLIQGYRYSLALTPAGYEVSASPQHCKITGLTVFVAATGGALSEKKCAEEAQK